MSKIKKYKVGLDSETLAISLVEEGAIMEDFVYMAKDDEMRKLQLSQDEKHMIYGPVLIPDLNIYRYDGQNEYYVQFSKDAIEKMSVEFMSELRGKNITLDHESDAPEIWVTESWLKVDEQLDKSVALGLNPNLPIGTWIVGMKCNNIDAWERIKTHSLNGFSVESLVSLEEFNKIEEKEDEMSESFWTRMKNMLMEVFSSQKIVLEEEPVEPTAEPVSEEPVEPTAEPTVEEPVEEPVVEPTVEEPTPAEPTVEEPKQEANAEQLNQLAELINNLRAEVEALKATNVDIVGKVKELESLPSAKPVSTNGKGAQGATTYDAWRNMVKRTF